MLLWVDVLVEWLVMECVVEKQLDGGSEAVFGVIAVGTVAEVGHVSERRRCAQQK